jgi:hypothetical protein
MVVTAPAGLHTLCRRRRMIANDKVANSGKIVAVFRFAPILSIFS